MYSPKLIFLILIIFCVHLNTTLAKQKVDIIPIPMELELQHGSFSVDRDVTVLIKDQNWEISRLGNHLVKLWEKNYGIKPSIIIDPSGTPKDGSLVLQTKSMSGLGDEGYELKITQNTIHLFAPKPAGLFYGIQTLRQLMINGQGLVTALPCMMISDKPRYAWRGMLLDCCRHFMTIDFIKRYIDLLAYHKMNVFHWHLTEDQGWRLEIKKYPLLTEIGAWREENGQVYGGFYTQEEVREVVEYARQRYITVVPEIDVPGHSTAALAAYPEYSCHERPIRVETNWGIFKDVFCPGKEKTFEFLQNILTEVADLFPSKYIHIGGDEVPKYYWEHCPDCQNRIQQENLNGEEELQGYFTKRIDSFVQTLDRKIIGWDEILEGGVSKSAVVQSWRGLEGAIRAAKMGNPVITSPWGYTYFYCPQVPGEARHTFDTINTLERVYSFDPIPDELTSVQTSYVMGGECCMWTEYTYQYEVDPQMFPRMCALAEGLWSPKKWRNYADFKQRLATHYYRLDSLGVDYYKPEIYIGQWKAGQISRSFSQLWWDVTEHITQPGIYRVNVVHDRGLDDIFVQWAALFENNEQVAFYEHLNITDDNMFMKYPLRLKSVNPKATYTLRVCIGGERDNDSAGSIYLRYFKDSGIQIP